MKVIVVNKIKNTEEYIECKYIKIEEDRILLVSDRTISIQTKDKYVSQNYQYKIKSSFQLDEILYFYISHDKVDVSLQI